MFVDTHAHLNFKQFEPDLDQVIERANDLEVKKIIVVGSNLENSKKAVKLAKDNSGLFASVGLHPTEIDLGWKKRVREIEEYCHCEEVADQLIRHCEAPPLAGLAMTNKAYNDKIVAIGEVGLDYHQKNQLIKKEVQIEALESLIGLAKKLSLPAIFHCREALPDFINILEKNVGTKGVVHCFQGSLGEAKKILNLGLLISFNGLITFSRDFDQVIKYVPIENILLETDCPFLSPEPYRGKRNEPAYVVEVARRIVEIKNIPLYKIAEETTLNAEKLFGI